MARLSDKLARHAERLSAPPTGEADTSPQNQGENNAPPILTELPLSQINPDPDQPRRDLGDLSELAASITANGVIQPIIVSVVGYEEYRIIAGERRYTAAKIAGLGRIPAIVRSVEQHRRLELQLVENLHRKDLNPFEEAHSYRQLLDEFGVGQEELAARLGRSQEVVSETLRLLHLPAQVQSEYATAQQQNGRLSRSLLVELSRRPAAEQTALWEEAKQGELTVRKLREKRAEEKRAKTAAAPPHASDPTAQEPRFAKSASGERGFRYPISLLQQEGVVTVQFAAFTATPADIIAALEEALATEKARVTT